MTEIEKMFENAGFKKREIENCTYKNSTPCGHSCDDGEDCPYLEIKIDYPPFTAEKQLKIIKLLSKIRGDIQLCCSTNQYIFVVNFETSICQWANKYHEKIDEALADMVNVLWQDLTDQDKEEIKGILNAR